MTRCGECSPLADGKTTRRSDKVSAARRKRLTGIGVALNLVLLGSLKYGLLNQIHSAWNIALPVGLSFYTFSQISFLIDRCRGEISHDSLLHYLIWITYFPKITEGPIAWYGELASQFREEKRWHFNGENFARGVALFSFGMGKKVLLADRLAPVVNYGFSALYLDTVSMTAVILSYALQLYLDFSGFCDMGMGIGWMMNIELPLNFDSPFQATSVSEFWGRWHMTLTRFLTKYVYFPLGGSRKGRARTCLNILIVFLLSGIWHGNGYTYLLWGLLCGLLVVIDHAFFRKRITAQSEKGTRVGLLRVLTFAAFCFTLFFFRASTVQDALILLHALIRPLFPGWITTAAAQLSFPELYLMEKLLEIAAPPQVLAWWKVGELAVTLLLCFRLMGGRNARVLAQTMTLRRRNAALIAVLLVWCMISMSGVSTFLYFKY